MSKPSPELLATGLYRIGMIALVSGFASMYANVEGLNPSAEGYSLVVAGIVIAIHGAVAPLAEYGLGRYHNWDRSPLVVSDDG